MTPTTIRERLVNVVRLLDSVGIDVCRSQRWSRGTRQDLAACVAWLCTLITAEAELERQENEKK